MAWIFSQRSMATDMEPPQLFAAVWGLFIRAMDGAREPLWADFAKNLSHEGPDGCVPDPVLINKSGKISQYKLSMLDSA